MQSISLKAPKAYSLKVILCAGLLALILGQQGFADEVQMRNGDRYGGTVISLTNDVLVLKSEVLGSVKLPRTQVRMILLGEPSTNVVLRAGTNRVQAVAGAINLNDRAQVSAAFRGLANNPALVDQVRNDLLGQATPEAAGKFNQMLSALMSGQMDVGALRSEAKSTADQLRAFKADLGEDAGWALDGYLAILDNFVRQSAPTPIPGTNLPPLNSK